MASNRTLPLWSRDETVLALWTATTTAGGDCVVDDPAIMNLSVLLRRAASRRAEAMDHRLRNPHGVARKVRRFRDLIQGRRSRRACAIEAAVWSEFQGNPKLLARAAEIARARLTGIAAGADQPSRGPVPTGYHAAAHLNYGEARLYLALLEGVAMADGRLFVKIGWTSDVAHREAELNFGFPAKLGIRWRMSAHWRLQNAKQAYQAEQTILQIKAAQGLSVGSEFLLLSPSGLAELVNDCDRILATITASELPAPDGLAAMPFRKHASSRTRARHFRDRRKVIVVSDRGRLT